MTGKLRQSPLGSMRVLPVKASGRHTFDEFPFLKLAKRLRSRIL